MRQRDDLAVGGALAVYVICFTVGTLSHARDFLVAGWRPYRSGVLPLDAFWTSLVGLDAAVVGLLLTGRSRAGLLAALVVMVADLTANAYASFVAGMPFDADRLILAGALPRLRAGLDPVPLAGTGIVFPVAPTSGGLSGSPPWAPPSCCSQPSSRSPAATRRSHSRLPRCRS